VSISRVRTPDRPGDMSRDIDHGPSGGVTGGVRRASSGAHTLPNAVPGGNPIVSKSVRRDSAMSWQNQQATKRARRGER
jgi:hypothetical protein